MCHLQDTNVTCPQSLTHVVGQTPEADLEDGAQSPWRTGVTGYH